VEELKGQVRAHRGGLATAFDPLREQVERLKGSFWERNGDVVEAAAKRYIERRIKERVTVEASRTSLIYRAPCHLNRKYLQVEKEIERYRHHLANDGQNNQLLKVAMEVS